jgi:hypothetical protein
VKSFLKFFLISLIISSTSTVFGQNTNSFSKSFYDPDPVLYNGKRYTYFPPLRTGGHQFLISENFAQGSVSLRGNVYENLLLNYDIYSQQLVLRFTNQIGALDQLIVSDAWLEGFTLDDMTFEYLQWSDSSWSIAQRIGEQPIEILILWHKNLSLDTRYGATNHLFSKALKKTYLRQKNTIQPFKNKRQFVKLFPDDFGSQLKRYLRKQRFSFKTASDQEIAKLLEFCALNLQQE